VQKVRSSHLHSGELHGSELLQLAFMSSYRDPTFREIHRQLTTVTAAAIVEWLKRGGTVNLPPLRQGTTIRRWIKDNLQIVLPSIFIAGLAIGWLLHFLTAAA
jgi:hypothetical protein